MEDLIIQTIHDQKPKSINPNYKPHEIPTSQANLSLRNQKAYLYNKMPCAIYNYYNVPKTELILKPKLNKFQKLRPLYLENPPLPRSTSFSPQTQTNSNTHKTRKYRHAASKATLTRKLTLSTNMSKGNKHYN